MMQDIESLLVNFSFIIIPLFIFQIFWVDKGRLYHKLTNSIITALASFSIIMCMTFPIQFASGFLFDLRSVPLILAALYGGYRIAIPLFLTIIIYRFYLGGNGVYVNFLVVSLLLIFVPLLKKYFQRLSVYYKSIFTLIIATLSATAVVILSKSMTDISVWKLDLTSFYYVLIHGLSMWLLTYIYETIYRNVLLKEKLVHTEKANVISQLAASVAHEVRNPLTVSKGFMQLLKMSDVSQEQRKSYVELSLSEMERAEEIINDYLSLAKANDKNLITSNFEDDLRYVMSVIKPYAAMHSVGVNTSFNNKLLINYDRNQVRQCLINLTKNCIEAMHNGGTLNVNISSRQDDVIINIDDTGIGMTEEEVSLLGKPYYTSKTNGTGLGMMMVFNTIQTLKGKIEIRSKKGKGTSFLIQIPSSEDQAYSYQLISVGRLS